MVVRSKFIVVASLAVGLALTVGSLVGCQSRPELTPGIQPNFVALNPTRILAITPIVVSLAGDKESVIDPVILRTMPIVETIEKKVLEAFKNQPSVNGVSFQAVRSALQKKGSPAYTTLLAGLDGTLGLLRKPRSDAETALGTACLTRKDFVGFYGFCLRQNRSWQKGLNELSATVLNADAALIVFVTELRTVASGGKEQARAALELVLVDTNNAELIWSGSARVDPSQPSATLDPAGSAKVQWAGVIDLLMTEPVWQGFPGRKPVPVPSAPPPSGGSAS